MWMAERGREVPFSELVDPNTTALIVIDMQNDFCTKDGAYGKAGQDASPMPACAARIRDLLAAARERDMLTVFVRATYDDEVTSRALAWNRRRRGLVNSLCLEGTWGAEWYGGVSPTGAANEVVLTKHRFDSFQGTPLDLYLRNAGIRTVVVTGVATSGCVESTVRHAFFKDYMVVVPHDAVAEVGLIYHEQSLAILERAFITRTTVQDIVAEWQRTNSPRAPSWRALARRARAAADYQAEGLVLVDVGNLAGAAAAAAEQLTAAARACGIPVFDVRTIDVAHGRSMWGAADETPGDTEVPVAATPAEMRIGKQRRSAFASTRLGLLLRTNGVRHLVVAGADAMPQSVLVTVLDGLDEDYAVSLASDACAGLDPAAVVAAGARAVSSREIEVGWRRRAPRVGQPSLAFGAAS